MFSSFKLLDDVLRGDATDPKALADGRVKIPITPILLVASVLGVLFGACIGCYTAFQENGSWMQPLASGLKIPLLFGLTLIVTLPSLYVFNALVGSRLTVDSVLRLLLAMIGVTLAVAASLGPIVVFFALSTKSYPFMLMLTVVASAIGGFLGLAFLIRTLHRLVVAQAKLLEFDDTAEVIEDETLASETDASADASEAASEVKSSEPGVFAPPRLPTTGPQSRRVESPLRATATDSRATTVFRIWVVVFALVGAQMSWVVRPFVGSPDLPFSWFRNMESNFFHAVWQTLNRLFGG